MSTFVAGRCSGRWEALSLVRGLEPLHLHLGPRASNGRVRLVTFVPPGNPHEFEGADAIPIVGKSSVEVWQTEKVPQLMSDCASPSDGRATGCIKARPIATGDITVEERRRGGGKAKKTSSRPATILRVDSHNRALRIVSLHGPCDFVILSRKCQRFDAKENTRSARMQSGGTSVGDAISEAGGAKGQKGKKRTRGGPKKMNAEGK